MAGVKSSLREGRLISAPYFEDQKCEASRVSGSGSGAVGAWHEGGGGLF